MPTRWVHRTPEKGTWPDIGDEVVVDGEEYTVTRIRLPITRNSIIVYENSKHQVECTMQEFLASVEPEK